MKKITNSLLLILFSVFSFFILNSSRCNETKAPDSNTVIKKKTDNTMFEVDDSSINKCESLLIIAEDRSGSTTNHRKLNKDDYQKIFDRFNATYYGQIAVRIIGNPAPEDQDFFTIKIDPPKKYYKIKKKDPLLSEKTVLRNKNKVIEEENQKIDANNKNKITNFIKDEIEPKIINYKPYNNKDVTNIEDALSHIQKKVHEPTFKNYQNIHVLIISDGVHDSGKLKEKLSLDLPQNANLYIIGWKDISIFDNIKNKDVFEAKDGFIEYYNELNCNK